MQFLILGRELSVRKRTDWDKAISYRVLTVFVALFEKYANMWDSVQIQSDSEDYSDNQSCSGFIYFLINLRR